MQVEQKSAFKMARKGGSLQTKRGSSCLLWLTRGMFVPTRRKSHTTVMIIGCLRHIAREIERRILLGNAEHSGLFSSLAVTNSMSFSQSVK